LKVGGLTSRESPVEDGHLTWIDGLDHNIEDEVTVRIGDGVNADKECGQNNFPIWRRMIDRLQGATTGA